MKVELKKNDKVKKCKIGFSWTIFCLSGLPLLSRGMYRHFFIVIATMGFASIYYTSFGNKLYILHLLNQGYEPVDRFSEAAIDEYIGKT